MHIETAPTPRTGPLYLLTGMNRSPGIFARLLPLLPNATVVAWIAPLACESIAGYAQRLAADIRSNQITRGNSVGQNIGTITPIICGVSFGGIVARYLAAALSAQACIIISSVAAAHQLPPRLRVAARLAPLATDKAFATAAAAARLIPAPLRTASTARLSKLAYVSRPTTGTTSRDAADSWNRWATCAFLQWANSPSSAEAIPADTSEANNATLNSIPLTQIHGTHDSTFPIRYLTPDISIAGGTHTLALTHAPQVAASIQAICASPAHGDRRQRQLNGSM